MEKKYFAGKCVGIGGISQAFTFQNSQSPDLELEVMCDLKA